MAGVGEKTSSVRFSRFESKRLALALALSLMVHLLGWGGYELGKQFNLWQQLHEPKWLQRVAKIKPPAQPSVQNIEPTMFLDVNPEQETAEAPRNAKYYSSRNSQAANPDAKLDTDVPQINGKQTDVPKTEDVRRPDFSKLQPTAPHAEEEQPQAQSKPKMDPGDLALSKPRESQEQQEEEQPRPRTLAQARAQQEHRLPGQRMKQEGGVRRRVDFSSLDSKRTLFGDYDSAFVDAVTQRWYDLLDSQRFALDRTGKVTVRFHLNYDGTISDMTILQNTVGDLLGYVCQEAISDPAPYAAWSSEMRRAIAMNYREITFTFYYY